MASFVNISTYKFAPLDNLKDLRLKLQSRCKEWRAKGTILLSTEGINLFVAVEQGLVDVLLAELRQIPGLEDLAPKLSESKHQPFRRMLVRIKKEIIAFGVEGINPAKNTTPKLPSRELKAWLDEGRAVTLLDVRNDYEIKLGTFENAIPIGVSHFRDFPRAVDRLSEDLRNTPVVMFCTGGIRCEKAGPYMEAQGFRNIFQLDGGILKYFEECGSAHYTGDCFVFDNRVGVDPSLHETDAVQCFACLTPLTAKDQLDRRFEKGISCPYCFKTPEEKMHVAIAARQELLRKVTNPLPGSQPYNQLRPLKISAAYDGAQLKEFLAGVLKHVPAKRWEEEFAASQILGPDYKPVTGEKRVSAGERYYCLTPNQSEPPVDTDIQIQYEDEAIIVLQKPAPLPVHACGRYNRNTLQNFLSMLYAPQRPQIAHRLDADTTGLVVATRTRHFASRLQPQFHHGEVTKTYLARVHGHPSKDKFTCDFPITKDQTDARVPGAHAEGQFCRTEFQVLKRFDNGTSLLAVNPITGRTNQIRIHLWELGFSIQGDQRFLPDREGGPVQTHAISDPPLCLHAQEIVFTHPVTGRRVSFSASIPDWAE